MRQAQRMPINRMGKIIQSDGTPVNVKACNISTNGICFISEYACDIDSEFDIVVSLGSDPLSGTLKAKAKACYVNLIGGEDKFRIGMKFTSFEFPSEDILNKYIEQRDSKPKFVGI